MRALFFSRRGRGGHDLAKRTGSNFGDLLRAVLISILESIGQAHQNRWTLFESIEIWLGSEQWIGLQLRTEFSACCSQWRRQPSFRSQTVTLFIHSGDLGSGFDFVTIANHFFVSRQGDDGRAWIHELYSS